MTRDNGSTARSPGLPFVLLTACGSVTPEGDNGAMIRGDAAASAFDAGESQVDARRRIPNGDESDAKGSTSQRESGGAEKPDAQTGSGSDKDGGTDAGGGSRGGVRGRGISPSRAS
jgi:hypothetical protein